MTFYEAQTYSRQTTTETIIVHNLAVCERMNVCVYMCVVRRQRELEQASEKQHK